MMLVVLDIKKVRNKNFRDRLVSLFRRSEIDREIRTQSGISVLNIRYRYYHGKVHFRKIFPYIKDVSDTVLCLPDIIPKKISLIRFSDNTLNIRLMENFLSDLLRAFPPNTFRISVFDPLAECAEQVERLFEYTSSLTVATEMTNYYANRAAAFKETLGTQLNIVDSLDDLLPCDILIYRNEIDSPLPPTGSAFVFTAYPPKVKTTDKVLYKFIPPFPDEYSEILPENIDKNYFLSALYSLCGRQKLDRLIPTICVNSEGAVTKEYLLQMLSENCGCRGSAPAGVRGSAPSGFGRQPDNKQGTQP